MSWHKNYDVVMRYDADLIIFGGHYDKVDVEHYSKDLFKEYFEDFNLGKIDHIWIRFGLVWIDDEKRSGYYILSEKPKSMRGVIRATYLNSITSIERSEQQRKWLEGWKQNEG